MKTRIMLAACAVFAAGLIGCSQDTATGSETEGTTRQSTATTENTQQVEMVTCPCGAEHPANEMVEYIGEDNEKTLVCRDCYEQMTAGKAEDSPSEGP